MDTYNSEEESGSEEESDYPVPLSVLTPDEAVQLLVVLGCVPELKERIEALELTGVVDGEFLDAIDGFDTLQELEQDTSAVRRARLKVVLKRLQILQMEGIPRPMLEDIRAMVAEAEAESRAALKRKADSEVTGYVFTNETLPRAVDMWCRHREKAQAKFGHISTWNTSQVTNMRFLFGGKPHFNDDISAWDVSNVTNMFCMFREARAFNQPIGQWDVSKVTDMMGLFNYAPAFNQPLGQWDVGNVTNMQCMFHGATAFNQPVGHWDVSKVSNMFCMFCEDDDFDQPIDQWDVGRLRNFDKTFEGTASLKHAIGQWNVGSRMPPVDYLFFESHSVAQARRK